MYNEKSSINRLETKTFTRAAREHARVHVHAHIYIVLCTHTRMHARTPTVWAPRTNRLEIKKKPRILLLGYILPFFFKKK